MRIIFRNKTPIIVSKKTIRLASKLFGFSVGAFALFPFIVVRDKEILYNTDYITHESIHIRQYMETLIFGLLIIGVVQYFYALVALRKSRMQAYYYMSHDQEAHQHDREPDYLAHRPWFSYYKYLLPKYKKEIRFENGKRIIEL